MPEPRSPTTLALHQMLRQSMAISSDPTGQRGGGGAIVNVEDDADEEEATRCGATEQEDAVEADCCSDSLSAWRMAHSLAGSGDASAEADDTFSVVRPYHYNRSRRDR